MEKHQLKLKWKLPDAPTGKYRSFHKREWPKAYYPNGMVAAFIDCGDLSYSPKHAKGEIPHPPLKLIIYDHALGIQQRKIRQAKDEFATIELAKEAAFKILLRFPDFIPTNWFEKHQG